MQRLVVFLGVYDNAQQVKRLYAPCKVFRRLLPAEQAADGFNGRDLRRDPAQFARALHRQPILDDLTEDKINKFVFLLYSGDTDPIQPEPYANI